MGSGTPGRERRGQGQTHALGWEWGWVPVRRWYITAERA